MESPCIGVCDFNGVAGICMGCGRSGAEIANWLHFSDEQRREIMAGLPERIAANRHPARRVTRRRARAENSTD